MNLVLLTAPQPGGEITGGHRYDAEILRRAPRHGVRVELVALSGRTTGERAFQAQRALRAASAADAVIVDSIVAAPVALAGRTAAPLVGLVHQLAATNVFAVGDRVRVALARSLYARCDLLIAVSPWIAARLNALGAPTVVVAPGVDRVAPRPPLAPGGAARVLCVANWIPNKRVLDLVDAFARLTEDAATLRLIGAQHPETRYGRAVARRIRRDDVRVRVHAPGTLERDGVAREYAAADIFALPSRDEAYGIAFAEALASGLPVVGYDSGYPPALVGEAGAFVRPGDVEALAWALSLIALDGDLRAAMSAQALARASALPTWDESATALFAALRSGIRIAPVRERGERDRAASGS